MGVVAERPIPCCWAPRTLEKLAKWRAPDFTLMYSDPLLANALERAVTPDERLTTVPWPSDVSDLTSLISDRRPDVLVLQGGGVVRVPAHEIAALIKATRTARPGGGLDGALERRGPCSSSSRRAPTPP